ncbi:DinB family protein [Deinococcus sp.]|uniref:DinB family protein n=1 Tax=Deinococcus sp. TaxID=47478 RepID=UPI003CC57EDA
MTAIESLTLTPVPAQTPEVGIWLSVLREARTETLKAAARIIHLDAQPERGNSAGTLLYHIAQVEAYWLYGEVLEQQDADFPAEVRNWFPFDMGDENGKLTMIRDEPLQRYLARLVWVRGRLEEVFGTMSLDEFRRVRHLEGEDVTPEWVLMHLALHEAHHEGQLALLT